MFNFSKKKVNPRNHRAQAHGQHDTKQTGSLVALSSDSERLSGIEGSTYGGGELSVANGDSVSS